MKSRFNWERLCGPMGILFAVLLLATIFSTGQPPDPDDPLTKYVAYYHDHRGAFLASNFLGGLATVVGFWFVAGLLSLLRRGEGRSGALSRVALGGFVGTGTVATIGGAVQTAAAFKLAGIDGAGVAVRALNDVSFAVFGSIGAFLAVFLGAVSFSAGRSGVLPRWLVLGGLVAALLEVVTLASIFGAQALGLLSPLLLVLWLLATGIFLTIRRVQLFPATESPTDQP